MQSLPLLHALREAYPDAELAWAVQAEFQGLFDGGLGLERRFLFERRAGLGAWLRLRRELEAWAPDWSIDAQGNVKSAMVALTSGAARRSGLARADWREPFAAHSLTDAAPPSPGRHAMQRNLALAQHVAPGSAPRFDPALSEVERATGRGLLELHAPRAEREGGYVLHLASAGDVRSWPAQSFADLAAELAEAGQRVLVLSGPAEQDQGAQLAARLGSRVHHWVGQRGLRDLAAVFTAAAEDDMRLVACDSGPAHLAAACGLAVRLLVGPQDPLRTGPWPAVGPSSPHRAISSTQPPECAPCLERQCTHPEGPVCMTALDPEATLSALNEGA